jgi:hypothetical protein
MLLDERGDRHGSRVGNDGIKGVAEENGLLGEAPVDDPCPMERVQRKRRATYELEPSSSRPSERPEVVRGSYRPELGQECISRARDFEDTKNPRRELGQGASSLEGSGESLLLGVSQFIPEDDQRDQALIGGLGSPRA